MKQGEEVMSNAELVKDLQHVQATLPKGREFSQMWVAVGNAITALSSQDDARDRALEEACAVQPSTAAEPKTDYEVGFLHGVLAYGRAIRALKSKPATSTAERRTGDIQWASSRPADPACWPSSGPTTQPPAPEVKQGLVEWLYDYAGKDGPPYSGTVTYADLVNFASEIDTIVSDLRRSLMGGKNV